MSIFLSLSHFPDFIPAKTNIIRAQLIIESQLHKRRKIGKLKIVLFFTIDIYATFSMFSEMMIMLKVWGLSLLPLPHPYLLSVPGPFVHY